MIRAESSIAAKALATISGHGLARYEAACRAIADARSVDEVKAIRDTAEAMRAAAHIAKNKQAEIDMAEIRFRGERRLGELMTAQREAGLLRAGNPNGFSENPLDKPVTLAEAGIDKNLADRARKFAAIPDDEFDGIVGDWREKVEAENERVTTNLLKAGARAESGRNENDFYPTPDSLIAEVVRRWKPRSRVIWEPCVGDGRVAAALRDEGYQVITGDIAQGQDFFSAAAPHPDIALCTNPPFGPVREFIDRAFAIGIKEMCLVLPERLWACGAGRIQFEKHRPSLWVNVDWREDYLGKGGSPDRALAVAIWDGPCAPACHFDVWTRQVAGDAETFDPETGEIIDNQEQPETASGETGMVPGTGRERPLSADLHIGSDLEARFESASLHQSHSAVPPPSADKPETVAPSLPTVSGPHSDADVPAFIKRDYVLRPHCLHPDMCAGEFGANHCWSCRKAAAEGVAA